MLCKGWPSPFTTGPAHDATFYVPSTGIVRFGFTDPGARGYGRFRDGSLAPIQPGARLFLSAGEHVLTLYDPKLVPRALIVFEPR
jgi:hypothetical protein